MKSLALFAAALWLAAMLPVSSYAEDQASASAAPQTQAAAPVCHNGPVAKSFGNTPWLIYGCTDGLTIFIVAADDNPAKPFYFTFAPGNDGHYHLHGEGRGDSHAVKATTDDLKALSKTDLQAMIDETKAMPHP